MEITKIQSLFPNYFRMFKAKPAPEEIPIRPTINREDYLKAKESTLLGNKDPRSNQIIVNEPSEKNEEIVGTEVPFRPTLDQEAYQKAKEATALGNEDPRSDQDNNRELVQKLNLKV